MKSTQVQLKAKSAIDSELSKLEKIAPQLVVMFGSHGMFDADGLALKVSSRFPSALVIGCSTAGEISNSGIDDETLVVTGAHFDSKVHLKPISATVKNMEETLATGTALGQQLDKKDLNAVFILGRGLEINGSALIEGLRGVVGKDVVITGGLAGDGGRFLKTFTVLNGKVSDSNVVGFGLYGTSVRVAYGSMGGWEPFGPVRKVTKSKQNVLFELDGEPALDVYKKYLGAKAKDLPGAGLLYPFAVLKDNQDTSGIIRTILGVDEKAKSVTLAGDILEGGIVRLMHSNNKDLVSGAKGAAEATSKLISAKKEHGLGILAGSADHALLVGAPVLRIALCIGSARLPADVALAREWRANHRLGRGTRAGAVARRGEGGRGYFHRRCAGGRAA